MITRRVEVIWRTIRVLPASGGGGMTIVQEVQVEIVTWRVLGIVVKRIETIH